MSKWQTPRSVDQCASFGESRHMHIETGELARCPPALRTSIANNFPQQQHLYLCRANP
jgi:hypothetical protein